MRGGDNKDEKTGRIRMSDGLNKDDRVNKMRDGENKDEKKG
jgi:hypothetical protein